MSPGRQTRRPRAPLIVVLLFAAAVLPSRNRLCHVLLLLPSPPPRTALTAPRPRAPLQRFDDGRGRVAVRGKSVAPSSPQTTREWTGIVATTSGRMRRAGRYQAAGAATSRASLASSRGAGAMDVAAARCCDPRGRGMRDGWWQIRPSVASCFWRSRSRCRPSLRPNLECGGVTGCRQKSILYSPGC
jgi:hypothetical protein